MTQFLSVHLLCLAVYGNSLVFLLYCNYYSGVGAVELCDYMRT